MRLSSVFKISILIQLLAGTIFASTSGEVGFSETKIDLPGGISLAGYLPRRVFKNFDSPYASYFKSSVGFLNLPRTKTIAIKSHNEITLLSSLEVVAIEPELRRKAEEILKEKTNQNIKLHLFATHTHSGAGGFSKFDLWQHLAIDKYNEFIFNLFLNSIVNSSLEAISNLQKARIDYQNFKLSDVTYNRRNSPTINTNLNLIKFTSENSNAPIVTIFNFPIHGTILGPDNLYISGDIPSMLELKLQESFKFPFVFISGAAGDIGPKITDSVNINSYSNAVELEKLSTKIVNQVALLWKNKKASQKIDSVINFTHQIDLPKATANLSLCLESVLPENFQWISKLFLNISLPQSLNKPMEVSIFKINDLTFYFIPGEPITEIGSQIETESIENNLKNPLLFTLGNSYYGYILTESEYKRGGYETCNSFYGMKYGAKFLEGMKSAMSSFKGFSVIH